MRIECLGTGSKGNHYRIVNSKGNILLVELGLPLNDILKGLDLHKVQGCIVSHNHQDHNYKGNVKKLASFGCPMITTENGVVGKVHKLGDFSIIPLPCQHNIKCFGYLINVDNYVIMFATDTKRLPMVKNMQIDIFMVEVNYIENMVDKILLNIDAVDPKLAYESRVLTTHNSLENTIIYFGNLNYKPMYILPIHASDNKNHYQAWEVQNELRGYAKEVKIVENGMVFEI